MLSLNRKQVTTNTPASVENRQCYCGRLLRFKSKPDIMNEKEVAERKVIPYLEKLGWPKQLITQ